MKRKSDRRAPSDSAQRSPGAARGPAGAVETPRPEDRSARDEGESAAVAAPRDADTGDRGLPFPIVGIGASAGGLEALTQLLEALPPDAGMAYVCVQHLDPTHTSALPELLARTTRMPVHEVHNGMRVERDHVYVIPPNTSMTLEGGHLRLAARESGRGVPMPVNDLFRSLAEAQGTRAIGIVLSGTASDGAAGTEAIKGAGGITFAQTEATAKFSGMPRSAIATSCVDFIQAPAEMAAELARIAGHHFMARADAGEHAEEPRDLSGILTAIRRRSGVDFSQYKAATVRRRVQRRMVLRRLDRVEEYARVIQEDPAEAEALSQDLLIRVTTFFRDPETFDVLQTDVFPDLVRGRPRDVPIRVWVPGCATGEEAYSLAICLTEFFDGLFEAPPLQLYATDLNDAAIQTARAGLFPDSIAADVSPERLRRFFIREEGGYRVSHGIRDVCVFAKQNLTVDPPFSQIDLVSCRNVLIYLTAPLQKRVFSLLHYALRPSGVLLLGSTETVGAFPELFTAVDRKHRIFRKAVPPPGLLPFDLVPRRRAGGQSGPAGHHALPGPEVATLRDIQKEADRALLATLAPAGAVVNSQLEVLQFRGRTRDFLEPPVGAATFHLLKMVKPELANGLRTALDEARASGLPALRGGIKATVEGRPARVSIGVVPFTAVPSGERLFIVLFTPETGLRAGRRPLPPAGNAAPAARKGARRVAELEQELASTREYMQAIVEEQEATNEELRSSTEEIQSSYEELQSSNEELETAKEELQSANEELMTVNEELHRRTLDLADANNDLTNFLGSVNIPMVRIGNDLRIRRFTPDAERILNVIASDVGRPIRDLTPKVLIPDFEARIVRVMDTLIPAEVEAQDVNRRWWSVRIRPYRTAEHKIDGVVVAFVDIDAMSESARAAKMARVRLEQLQTFAAALARSSTPAQLASVITGAARDAVAAASVVLVLKTPRGAWEPLHATGAPPDVLARLQTVSASGGGPMAWVAGSGHPIVLSSPTAIAQRFPEAAKALAALDMQALILVPLETDGETFGALALFFITAGEPGDYDLALLQVFAQVGALALRRAQEHATDRSLRHEVASARLGSDVVNQATVELLAVVREELSKSLGAGGPAAWAVGSGEEPGGLARGSESDASAIRVAPASALVEQLISLLLVDAEDRSLAAQPVNVGDVLADAAAAVDRLAVAKHIALAIRPPARRITVDTDRTKLRQALTSLLTGAIRLVDSGDIALQARSDDGAVVVEVRARTAASAGPGLSRMFGGETDTSGSEDGSSDDASLGTGVDRLDAAARLAFTVARRLATHLGGRVVADMAVNATTTFGLHLPAHRPATALEGPPGGPTATGTAGARGEQRR